MRLILRVMLFLLAMLSPAARARQVDLTILYTTDMHGNIWPTDSEEGQMDVGGFLRCAARIDEIRAQTANTLVVDVGDSFQGAPESFLTGGSLIVDGLNFMRYDAWILGNHEIDWGPQALAKLHEQAEIPFLAANLYFSGDERNWLPKIMPYVIREIDGIRVAIIGLTTPGIPRWSRPHLLDGAMFMNSVPALQEVMPAVRAEGPDVIVVAAHQGYKVRGDDFASEIQTVMTAFPEIDVLLGGHTHTPVDDMRFNGVLYSQAGYHGIWLGRVDLVYDTVAGAVVSKRGQLQVMDASVPFHQALLARWQPRLDEVKAELDKVIGYNPTRLTTGPDAIGRSPVQQLIARAIAGGTGSGLVLHGSLGDATIEPGPFTYRDVWKIVPYENTVGLLALTPQEIRMVLGENHGRSLSSHSLGPYGFTYTLAPRGPADQRITDLRDDAGDPLQARKRYAVAMNSYVLASGGNRYNGVRNLADQPESRLQMLPVDTRSLVVSYIRKHWNEPEQAAGPE